MSSVAPADLPVDKDLADRSRRARRAKPEHEGRARQEAPDVAHRDDRRRSSSPSSGRSRPSACSSRRSAPAELIRTTGWWTIFQNPGLTLENYSERAVLDVGVVAAARRVLRELARDHHAGDDHPAGASRRWRRTRSRGSSSRARTCSSSSSSRCRSSRCRWRSCRCCRSSRRGSGRCRHGCTTSSRSSPSRTTCRCGSRTRSSRLPLAIFLLHNFISEIPGDVIEAARVDGATHGQIFFRIVLPLAMPALASFAIFQFIWVWNDLLVALIFSGGTQDVAPLTQRLAELIGTRGQEWQLLTAAAFVSIVDPADRVLQPAALLRARPAGGRDEGITRRRRAG